MNTEEKPMKLISMVDFVLTVAAKMPINADDRSDYVDYMNAVENYAKFLSQPLTLGMFVPVDENGNALQGKPLSPAPDSEWIRWENEEFEFYKAKDKVLFEGFTLSSYGNGQYSIKGLSGGFVVNDGIIYDDSQDYAPRPTSKTIEHLLQWNENLKLTQTAKNKIFQ